MMGAVVDGRISAIFYFLPKPEYEHEIIDTCGIKVET